MRNKSALTLHWENSDNEFLGRMWNYVDIDGVVYGYIFRSVDFPDKGYVIETYYGAVDDVETLEEAIAEVEAQAHSSGRPIPSENIAKKNVSNKTGKNTSNVNLISGKPTNRRSEGMNRQQIAKRRTLASRERLKRAGLNWEPDPDFEDGLVATIDDVSAYVYPSTSFVPGDPQFGWTVILGEGYVPSEGWADSEEEAKDIVESFLSQRGIVSMRKSSKPVHLKKAGMRNIRKPVARNKTAVQYGDIVFLEGSEAEEILNIIDKQGEAAGLEYLEQWDYGDVGEVRDQEPWGSNDRVYQEGDLVMSYNDNNASVGLTRILDDDVVAKRKANRRPVRKPVARNKKAAFEPENGNPDVLVDEFDNTLYFENSQWILRIISGGINKTVFDIADYGNDKEAAKQAAIDFYNDALLRAYTGKWARNKKAEEDSKSDDEDLDFDDTVEDESFDPEEGDVEPDIVVSRRRSNRRNIRKPIAKRPVRKAAEDDNKDDAQKAAEEAAEQAQEQAEQAAEDAQDAADEAAEQAAEDAQVPEQTEDDDDDKRNASVKVAVIRLADNYIELGLEDSSQRYDLMAEFSGLSDATINDRLELLSKVAHMAKKTASVREVSTPVRKASSAKAPSFARAPKMSSFDDSEDDDFMLGLL